MGLRPPPGESRGLAAPPKGPRSRSALRGQGSRREPLRGRGPGPERARPPTQAAARAREARLLRPNGRPPSPEPETTAPHGPGNPKRAPTTAPSRSAARAWPWPRASPTTAASRCAAREARPLGAQCAARPGSRRKSLHCAGATPETPREPDHRRRPLRGHGKHAPWDPRSRRPARSPEPLTRTAPETPSEPRPPPQAAASRRAGAGSAPQGAQGAVAPPRAGVGGAGGWHGVVRIGLRFGPGLRWSFGLASERPLSRARRREPPGRLGGARRGRWGPRR